MTSTTKWITTTAIVVLVLLTSKAEAEDANTVKIFLLSAQEKDVSEENLLKVLLIGDCGYRNTQSIGSTCKIDRKM